MRRGFNKAILTTEPPQKHRHVEAKKTRQRKSAMMQELMSDYRIQAGQRYSLEDFAKALDVQPSTAKRYFSGYFPHQLLFWNIARYFSPLIGTSSQIIRDDIYNTWIEEKLRR